MSVISIHSQVRDYTVHFQNSAAFLQAFDRFPQRLFVIDANVWRCFGEGILSGIPEAERLLFTASEERKGLASVMEIYDRLMERAAKKNMTLISLGGGIVQDVTGFVASTLYRGLNWVFVPTTLLAQSDSCIGSKTSLNYQRYKNLIGTFYPPTEVHIFPDFLTTLEDADFLSGLGEVVKLHLMGGAQSTAELTAALPALMAREPGALLAAIKRSLSVKLSYMEGDEFDTGRRNLLNFGHCFGHALETVSDYAIPHGQAVVIGMLLANIASVQSGRLAASLGDLLAETLLFPSLSVPLARRYFELEPILAAMKQDKKRVGDGLVLVMMADGYSFEKNAEFSCDALSAASGQLLELLAGRGMI